MTKTEDSLFQDDADHEAPLPFAAPFHQLHRRCR